MSVPVRIPGTGKTLSSSLAATAAGGLVGGVAGGLIGARRASTRGHALGLDEGRRQIWTGAGKGAAIGVAVGALLAFGAEKLASHLTDNYGAASPKAEGTKSAAKSSGSKGRKGRSRAPTSIDELQEGLYTAPVERIKETMRELNALPEDVVWVGDTKYSLTRPFRIDGCTVASLAVVEAPGEAPVLRTFYQSRSQGNFRLVPALNGRSVGQPEYDKGVVENMLSAPRKVQEALSKRVVAGELLPFAPHEGGNRLFGSATARISSPEEYERYFAKIWSGEKGSIHDHRPLVSLTEGGTHLSTPGGGLKPSPQHMVVEGELAPRFDRPVATYRTDTFLHGPVEAEVFGSPDGALEYTFFREANSGRGWLASVDVVHPNVQQSSFGVSTKGFGTSGLTSPLYEYEQQIPAGFVGDRHPDLGYVSNWKYVSQIPLIRQWFKAMGRTLPA